MSSKRFRIAFSFAGEKRDFVEKTAAILAKRFNEKEILYDKYHEAEFANADLAFDLPAFYKDEADLIVSVFCNDYWEKEWCGCEWRAIFATIKEGGAKQVMLTRFDKVDGQGLFGLGGFIELDGKTPEQFAKLILERLAINEGHSKDHYIKPAAPEAKPDKPHAPHYLPRLDHFHGREKELAQIRDALRPEKRTWGALIAGPGGMGKTSLAVRAASEYTRDQFDPVIFVSIKDRALEDEGPRAIKVRFVSHYLGILDEIARALGRDEISRSSPEDRARLILEALTGTRALLILDNLESLTPEDRERIVEFVGELPLGCKAILTARRRIGRGINLIELDKLDEAAALATLADIAEHNNLLARSTESQRKELWKETAGIPLLLRWTAGQLGRGACRTIPDAIAFLRSCPENNDPLEFIFGDLAKEFSEDETKVLCALTYFTLPVKVEHIAANADLKEPLADTALRSLANRSLVTDNAEGTHYALIPLVADFLRKSKPEVVEEAGNRLEKRAYALIMENGYQEFARFPILEGAWPGIAPALLLFLAGDHARFKTVCDALQYFLQFQGRWDEWLALCEEAETRAVTVADHCYACWMTFQTGFIYYLRQQSDTVLACADRAPMHCERAKAGPRERAITIRLRGLGHILKKDYSSAALAYKKALDLYRSFAAESADIAMCLNDLAGTEKASGDRDAAERHFNEALQMARVAGDNEGVALYVGNLAQLALDRSDWPTAEALAREGLQLAEAIHRQDSIAIDNRYLAHALLRQGKASEALPHAQNAVNIITRLGSPELARTQAILDECKVAINEGSQT